MGIVKRAEALDSMPDSTRVKEEVEKRKNVVEEELEKQVGDKPVGAVVTPPEEKPPVFEDLPEDALLSVPVPFTKSELRLLERQRITPEVIRYIVVGGCVDGSEDEV